MIKHLCIESADDEQKYLSDFISKMERGIPLTTNMTDEMFCDLRNIPREKCINQIKIRMSYKHNRINLYNYDLLKLQMTYWHSFVFKFFKCKFHYRFRKKKRFCVCANKNAKTERFRLSTLQIVISISFRVVTARFHLQKRITRVNKIFAYRTRSHILKFPWL